MPNAEWRASEADIALVLAARHGDPFAFLGPHDTPDGTVIRAFVPGAERLRAIDRDGALIAALTQRHAEGFFEGLSAKPVGAYRLAAENAGGAWTIEDPYRFGPVLGPLDDHLMVEGTHTQLYERLGAHPTRHEGVDGVAFAVWAPHARRVSVVGDFNQWDGRRHEMRRRVDSGLWEIFAPGVGLGTVYKFEIVGPDGIVQPLKADPFGFGAELRPSTASVVTDTRGLIWTDAAYMARRAQRNSWREPMAIYELHLGSWRRPATREFMTYEEIADALIPYVVDLGFTHIELMPVSEHPLDASWGYQPIGLFAPTARHGDAAGFARLVDRAHAADIGVILDWVPAHFPTDAHGLARFDGAPLYEYADPRRGFHPDWNTAIYDFGRREVANFLAASALYWLDRFHVDGLRVDAVASMLYLDYSRKEGEWIPNIDGGRDNREAVAFLQSVNRLVGAHFPGVLMIAEESTAWDGVCRPTDQGGLGFGYKWNLGWMHDSLGYFMRDPIARRWHHDELTFQLLYAFSENFLLPLSHDEVVHGKRSILGRMPGDPWQRFATLRAYYAYMWACPGKKLLFMGQEFGQWAEWNFAGALDWDLLERADHRGAQACVRDLNRAYRGEPALHARDCEPEGFRWLVVDDALQSVYAWLRQGAPGDPPVAVLCNFTPVPRHGYRVGLPHAGVWRELVNTDAAEYGGSGLGNFGSVHARAEPHHGFPASAEVLLPPLATLWLRFEGPET